MSDYFVLKPFNTTIHRFRPGDAVHLMDDLSPHTFEGLKERGFIKGQSVKYDAMTKDELESMALERGIDVGSAATKADIVASLQYADKRDEAVHADNLDALLKSDLERLAGERGLDISGAKTKSDLIALLSAAPAH